MKRLSGGNHATGLRNFRRPAAIACLFIAVAGTAAFLPDRQTHRTSVTKPVSERVRPDSSRAAIPRLEAIRKETDPMRREQRIAYVIESFGLTRVPAALDELHHLKDDPLTNELGMRLLHRWAEDDAAAAAGWADSLPEGKWRTAALKQAAIAWSNEHLNQAENWARSLPDELERDSQLLAIAHEAVRSDPLQALQIAADLPASGSSDELIRRAAMEWASKDAEGAAEWARKIEGTTLREQVLSGVALAWGAHDPIAAATFVVNELPPGRLQTDALVGIVQRWTQNDPVQATAWVKSFPEGTLRREAMASLAQQGRRAAE